VRDGCAAAGLPVSLSQWDLHHAHLFWSPSSFSSSSSKETATNTTTTGGDDDAGEVIGALFHLREYPAFHPDDFPHRLGYCQEVFPAPHHPHSRARTHART
jgi:hypothetical protein